MKKIFIVLIFLSIIKINEAQIQVGVVLGPQFPVGGFTDAFNSGIGFGSTGKYFMKENMAVGTNLHYNYFTGDRYYNEGRNRAAITAFTGMFQYYFSTDKIKPYAGGDFGLYFWNWRWYTYYWINPAGNPAYGYYHDNGTALGFAPSGGITYDITDKFVLDGNLKFNLILTESDLNYLGMNLGLFYKFDK